MSQGNLGADIGLANSSKVPMVGGYHQSITKPGPGAGSADYMGVQATSYWNRNWLGENYAVTGGITVLAASGVAAGKLARWVSTGASPMTVAADGLCSVSAAGVVTATPTTGLYKTYITPAKVVPAGSFLWVFGV
jgi:hypothetical protein